MKNYCINTTFKIFSILIFTTMYISCGSKNECWVCEGDGINSCVVCVNEKTEMEKCSFCDIKGNVICTFCNGSGTTK